jgi:site-specific recombinase XerD
VSRQAAGRHYSHLTEKAYVTWIRRFILFHGKQHPLTLGPTHVEAFLSHLAVSHKVSSSTQNQALNALLFLYRRVLEVDLPCLRGVVRAKKPARLPVVLTPDEVAAVLAGLRGTYWLVGALLYGSGLRLMECLRLRAKDVDLSARQLTIRGGKGDKDRVTVLAATAIGALEQHLARRREQHRQELARGSGAVHLPEALHRICDSLASARPRHSYHPRADGAQRRQHDDGLHPCRRYRRDRNR